MCTFSSWRNFPTCIFAAHPPLEKATRLFQVADLIVFGISRVGKTFIFSSHNYLHVYNLLPERQSYLAFSNRSLPNEYLCKCYPTKTLPTQPPCNKNFKKPMLVKYWTSVKVTWPSILANFYQLEEFPGF